MKTGNWTLIFFFFQHLKTDWIGKKLFIVGHELIRKDKSKCSSCLVAGGHFADWFMSPVRCLVPVACKKKGVSGRVSSQLTIAGTHQEVTRLPCCHARS